MKCLLSSSMGSVQERAELGSLTRRRALADEDPQRKAAVRGGGVAECGEWIGCNAEPATKTSGITFLILLLPFPCGQDCTSLSLHLLPAWLCKTYSHHADNRSVCWLCSASALMAGAVGNTETREKATETDKVHWVEQPCSWLRLAFCGVKIFYSVFL